MDLLSEITCVHFKHVPYANIIFDHERRNALNIVLGYLERFGLVRESDDLDPVTDWQEAYSFTFQPELALAGRFAQWKYFWTDDCILRGLQISGCLK